jgi:hypothetical protein
MELFAQFRSRLCTDPRDKVYGLLGLCSAEEKKKILPDYFTPVSLVYEQVALDIIKKNQSLDVFSQVCRSSFDGVELATVNLPSWVPDWTLEMTGFNLQCLKIRQERNHDYKASSQNLPHISSVKMNSIMPLFVPFDLSLEALILRN